ncbi:Putative O-methyltransferase [Mycolicibacterium vanbaalenii]|uniref:O-methyltransferase n=1 Tax=Mycolicibacterium vanbaalenii TaxID=110539 RepID=A0A5S9QXC1_MYCVN|nr:Putative O-methyltransferase [Mycolicibacterium vanbaalenii]
MGNTGHRGRGNVAAVTTPDWVLLDELFTRVLHTEDDAMRAARDSAEAEGMPPIEVSAQHAKLLSLLVSIAGARRVLEIGTLAGYSTIALARAVGADGAVVSLEYEAAHADLARRNLERAEVADRVEVIVGAALDTLPTLQQRGDTFDLVFIDADKENNVAYVQWAITLGRPGTVIVVDNIARNGRVLDPEPADRQAQAIRDMLDMMGAHPRLDTAAIQTVGAKNWDGFAVAVVR